MALNEFKDDDLKAAIEYNCKQWCGNHSVKYNPENIICPVSQEEHAAVVANKSEGMVFSFDYQGSRVYGYYQATKPQAAVDVSPPAGANDAKPARLVGDTPTVSREQLPVVGSDDNEVSIEQLFEKIDKKMGTIRYDIIVLDSMFDELKERINAKAQAPVGKPKGKRAPSGQRRGRGVSGVSDKAGKHENRKSRKPVKESTGVLL